MDNAVEEYRKLPMERRKQWLRREDVELKLRYVLKGLFVNTEMQAVYTLVTNEIILTKWITTVNGVRKKKAHTKTCRPYLGSFSKYCRLRTHNAMVTGQIPIDYALAYCSRSTKPENAWTKCEFWYQGRWVKAHTVRECMELKGRLNFDIFD
tara:strand:+ start:166 stop:621 length:456 start_codon:yes stop_codon:yes gene_type:complete